MSNVPKPPVRSGADLRPDADDLRPMTPTPISPSPYVHGRSGAPPFMLPAYRRRRRFAR